MCKKFGTKILLIKANKCINFNFPVNAKRHCPIVSIYNCKNFFAATFNFQYSTIARGSTKNSLVPDLAYALIPCILLQDSRSHMSGCCGRAKYCFPLLFWCCDVRIIIMCLLRITTPSYGKDLAGLANAKTLKQLARIRVFYELDRRNNRKENRKFIKCQKIFLPENKTNFFVLIASANCKLSKRSNILFGSKSLFSQSNSAMHL